MALLADPHGALGIYGYGGALGIYGCIYGGAIGIYGYGSALWHLS